MRHTFPSGGSLTARPFFSRWDLLAIPLLLLLLALLSDAFRGAQVPFDAHSPDLTVSTDPAQLPYDALRSFARMLVAVFFSLAFTFTYATLAAKSRRAGQVLIPVLDFLQSLPILGFLTATTVVFLGLFRGSLLGLEAACVFAVFTSQAWNMAFSFYHSLITVPRELQEVAAQLRLSAWQRFWKLEVPYAMPGLVWNTMMSVSGGWFFVVASEVISVPGRANAQALPGLGSYIAAASAQADLRGMVLAGVTLLALVLVYDQLLFRPIVAWAEKFRFELSASSTPTSSWMLTLLQRARLLNRLFALPAQGWERLSLSTARGARPGRTLERRPPRRRDRALNWTWNALIMAAGLALLLALGQFVFGPALGLRAGQLPAANPNLNPWRDPAVAQRFASAGVRVEANGTVWLSSACAAGGRASPVLEKLAQDGGVTDLRAACDQPLAQAGRVSLREVPPVLGLGLITALRVVLLIALAVLVWLPIGVWIGLNPRLTALVQPLAQFLAAFPSNLIFPLAVIVIVRLNLNHNVFLSPLMVLGTQWYILFNVIAGAVAIPNDLKEAARVSGLRGLAWWRRLILPAVFPALVTGGITASGGSWNASIVAEVVTWGSTTLVASGLGAYIARWSTGEFNPHVALGMTVMGLFVLLMNRLIWRRLYALAEERYRLG